MNISLLLRELSAHGVELEPERLSLPAPNWPDQCPTELRQAFGKNRRELMARIAPPVFVYMGLRALGKASAPLGCSSNKEIFGKSVVVAQIDDEIILWLPSLAEESTSGLIQRLGLQQRGMSPERVQIATGRSLPPILRRAVRSGRAFCAWDAQSVEASYWHAMGFPVPVRWVDLRDLARAGGWPEDFDNLLWNFLPIRPAHDIPLPTRRQSNSTQSDMEVLDQWTMRIRMGLDHLLGVADLYDRLKQHDEPELVEVHQAINRSGLGLDVERAKAVLNLVTEYAEDFFAGVTKATNGTMTAANLLDDGYVLSWLRAWGLKFPNLNAETIEWLQSQMRAAGLRQPAPVEAVLDARLLLARQPVGGLRRALELVDGDGRVRNHMIYFANRVGEFASQGIAISTLARNAGTDPCQFVFPKIPTVDELITDCHGGTSIEETLSRIVADCFIPTDEHFFDVYDWPYLKAAVLNWMAGKPSSPLSCINRFQIERTQRALARKIRDALDEGRLVEAGRCELAISSATIEICLPSKRRLHYREVRTFQSEPTVDESPTPLRSPAQTLRTNLNEHVILDEMVRAIRRDIVADALLKCVEAGSRVVAHGPDLIITEVNPRSRGALSDAMLMQSLDEPPVWAKGLECHGRRIRTARLGGGYDLMCPEQAPQISIVVK